MANTSPRKRHSFQLSDLRVLGLIGFAGLFFDPRLKLFFLFFLFDFLGLFRRSGGAKGGQEELEHYYRTLVLSQFNVIQWPRSILQLAGHFVILLRHSFKLPAPHSYASAERYRLPFEGRWAVVNGGSTKENSHSWDIYTQRYAYDFVVCDENGKSHSGTGRSLTDYYCWGKTITAIAGGEVVAVKNNINDHLRVGDHSIDWKTGDFRGNFVVVRHATNEFGFYAHLMKGSVRCKKGDRVYAGQVLGLCGNSGHSTEPHLHFHLQDLSVFWFAAGLPVRFYSFTAVKQGNSAVRSNGFAEKGETVENLPDAV